MARPGAETGQLTTITATATEAAVAAFQAGDAERAIDFQQFMEGTPHQMGGQHDMSPRGMTSDKGEFQQPPDTVVPIIADQATYVQSQPTVPPPPQAGAQQGQDFQRLYGQSENEKGELRRALQQQMDANAQLLAQVQQLVNTPPPYSPPYPNPYDPQFVPNGYNGNQYGGYSNVPTTINQPYPPPRLPQRLVRKNDGEMVFTEDLEGTLQDVVAPAYYTLHQETQRALGEAAQLRQMLVQAEKERRGITPQLEAAALAQQPWLRNLQSNPNPAPYLGALATFAESQRNLALLQRTSHPQVQTPPTPPALTPGTAASAGRRITYVEGSNSPSQAFEPQNGQNAFDREMAQAMSEPHIGKRAGRMREVMAKYGINQANDWRDPSVTTR